MSTTKNELVDFFEQIDKRTREGEIGWSRLSPTSYAAIRDTASGKKRMTIQAALSRDARSSDSASRAVEEYLNPLGRPQFPHRPVALPVDPPASGAADDISARLQPFADLLFQVEAVEGNGRRAEVSIDTRERRDLQQALARLFESAELSADKQTVRILRELVRS